MGARNHLLAALLAFLLTGCAQRDAPPIPDLSAIAAGPELASRLTLLSDGLRDRPKDPAQNAEAARLLHAYGQLEPARALYERAEIFAPDHAAWPYLRGVTEMELGALEASIEAFERTLELNAHYAPAWRRLAAARLEQGRLDDARRCFDRALAIRSDDAEARLGLGRVESAAGRADEALAQIRQAVRIAPDYGLAHYELALALRDIGDRAAASEHTSLYERFRYSAPPSDDPILQQVRSLNTSPTEYLQQAAEAQRRGDLDSAVKLTESALAKDPSLTQAHLNLLILHGRAGRNDLAEAAYQRAVQLAPERADLHYNYGVLAFQQGRRSEAKRAFQAALDSNPSYAAALNNFGQVLELEGRYDEALDHYQRALKARPNYRLARYHLARMLLARNQVREAVGELETIVGPDDSESPEYLFALAMGYRKLGRSDDARAAAARALELARGYRQDGLADAIASSFSPQP